MQLWRRSDVSTRSHEVKIPTPIQEEIIGRTKIDNIEIDDDDAPRKSHKSLATIVDAGGNEYDILRDNMPFGRPGQREFGTYFIGYSRYLWVIEKMLQRMYVGPAWRLRPAARFLDPPHRHNVLRAISPDAAKTCSGGAGEAYRSYSLTRYPASLEIARFSMSASGHQRPGWSWPHDHACPLRSESDLQ